MEADQAPYPPVKELSEVGHQEQAAEGQRVTGLGGLLGGHGYALELRLAARPGALTGDGLRKRKSLGGITARREREEAQQKRRAQGAAKVGLQDSRRNAALGDPGH